MRLASPPKSAAGSEPLRVNEQDQPRSGRRFLAALAGLCLIAVGVLAVVFGSLSATEPNEVIGVDAEVEVCDTTEYEGCPQRWDYLFADED